MELTSISGLGFALRSPLKTLGRIALGIPQFSLYLLNRNVTLSIVIFHTDLLGGHGFVRVQSTRTVLELSGGGTHTHFRQLLQTLPR